MRKLRLFISLSLCGLVLAACSSDEEPKEVVSSSEVAQSSVSVTEKDEIKKVESTSKKEKVETREDAIGKSDKDIDDIEKYKPTDVRNDVTESWKKVLTSKPFKIEEYALSYGEKYIKEDDGIHVMFNFANNTTTVLLDTDADLFVDIYEYVSKEEHDAKNIPSGMLLGSFIVHKDNGDIEQTE